MKKLPLLCVLCLLPCMLVFRAPSPGHTEESIPAPLAVDLDLSDFSGTLVYSQVYHIFYEPEAYLGKVIKIAGFYSAFEDTERGVVYHTCVIPDATACCAQGIEFVWGGEHQWPNDYPDEGTPVTVTGILEAYDEDGVQYLHLADSEVIFQ